MAEAKISTYELIIKFIPLELILPIVFVRILDSIKNPDSKNAKKLESVLIPFGQQLVSKYPNKICT